MLKTAWGHIYTLFFVVIGWVIFSQTDSKTLLGYLKAMAGIGVEAGNGDFLYYLSCNAVLLIALIICSLDWSAQLGKVQEWLGGKSEALLEAVKIAMMLALFLLSLAFLVGDSYNPFLYFRF